MANLKEQAIWEVGIYQWETSDPVLGGENGIDNVPPRQLANRTLWLKTELARCISEMGTQKADKATTLAGYGISDAFTQSQINNLLAGKVNNTVSVTGTSGLKGGGVLTGSQSLTIDKATSADIDAGTANKVVTADTLLPKLNEKLTAGNLSTTNLNAISKYGSYGQDQNLSATVARNYPYQSAGRLDVSPGPFGVMQEYTTINGAKAVRYAIANDLGTWGDWVKLSTLVQKLGDADNLNNIKEYGIYGQDMSAKALLSLNYPLLEAGTLEVKIGTYGLMQTYLTISGRFFLRRGQPSNTWSDWIETAQIAVNNLLSDSPVQPLSAAMGKLLKAYFDTCALKTDFASSLASAGYTKLPNGMLLQWGLVSMPPNSSANATLPMACNSIMQAFATYDAPAAAEYPTIAVGGFTTTTLTIAVKAAQGSNYGVRWFALCR